MFRIIYSGVSLTFSDYIIRTNIFITGIIIHQGEWSDKIHERFRIKFSGISSDYIIRIRGILEKKNRAREERHMVGKVILLIKCLTQVVERELGYLSLGSIFLTIVYL
jgi:hypothetical protein